MEGKEVSRDEDEAGPGFLCGGEGREGGREGGRDGCEGGSEKGEGGEGG